MDDGHDLPVLLWPVSCFDRRRDNPLPVYNRWYWLDWAQLTAEQTNEILAIIDAKKERGSPHKPLGFDESVVTMSMEGLGYDREMLKHRKLFKEVPENDVEAFLNHPNRHKRGFQTVDVADEYFEDETGAPITDYEVMQFVTGQEFPIVVGDPTTVLRLGPTSAVNQGDWSVEKANTIAQFLDIVERIHSSQWYRSPRRMTSLVSKVGEPRLLEADFPGDEDTMSVLAYFRQLHAGDKRSCERRRRVHHACWRPKKAVVGCRAQADIRVIGRFAAGTIRHRWKDAPAGRQDVHVRSRASSQLIETRRRHGSHGVHRATRHP